MFPSLKKKKKNGLGGANVDLSLSHLTSSLPMRGNTSSKGQGVYIAGAIRRLCLFSIFHVHQTLRADLGNEEKIEKIKGNEYSRGGRQGIFSWKLYYSSR